MNEKHYILPPISNTPPRSRENDSNSGASETITIVTTSQRRQSKIPILFTPSKSVQEYLALSKSAGNTNDLRFSNNETLYSETPLPNPQYTDKWKFQYMTINKQLKHMSNRRLFTDNYFDLTDPKNNIGLNNDFPIVWMRPKDLVDRPVIGINSTNYKDVTQGKLDDCAFVAACDSLSKYPFLLKNIFHKDVDLYGTNYNGCVKIRLWINDEWIWICIDDRLPTVNGQLYYAHSSNPEHFWVSLVEKAYAKYYGCYENLIGIDSATVLINLTGGVVLRLNPTIVNDRDNILYYLNRAFDKRIMIAIAGAELIFNPTSKSGAKLMKAKKNESQNKRSGHAYALIDIIYAQQSKKFYIKLHNCQKHMKVFKEIANQEDMKILEAITQFEDTNDPNRDNSNTLYFSYDEFFDYFETLNIVVILNDYLSGFDVSASGFWNTDCGLKLNNKHNDKIIDKYLKSPHFYFNLINKGSKNGNTEFKQINFIVNLVTDLVNENEFIGVVILPIREKPSIYNKEAKIHFINYTIHRQTLCHVNPLCLEIKLLPGKYMIGLVTQAEILPKRFCLRLATNTPHASIMRLQELLKQEDADEFILAPTNNPNSRPRIIKIILSKCCVCNCLLDESFITSGAKVFCTQCYNLTFRCDICDVELGQVYYTLEQRLSCENCLNNYTKGLNIIEAAADDENTIPIVEN